MLHRVKLHIKYTLRMSEVLWCSEKPHRVEARDGSSHWVKKPGMNPRSCSFTKVLEQLLMLRNPSHLESGGAVPCAGLCLPGDQPCSADIHRSECAVQHLNNFSPRHVAQGSSPLNPPVLLSCKYLLPSQARLLSPQTNKYSVKSSV